MSQIKDDRRTRRTKHLLSQALVSLMMEKPFNAITVQDIIDKADVGRSTFYAHYRDKDDLFDHGLEGLFHGVDVDIAGESNPGEPGLPSLELFRHVGGNYPLYKALAHSHGIDRFYRTGHGQLSRHIETQINEYVAKTGVQPAMPPALLADYVSSALLNMLKWWLENNMPYPPERMDTFFKQLVMEGVRRALGQR